VAKAGGKFIKREMTTAKKGRMVYWQRKPSSIGVGLDAHCTQRWEGGHDGCSANPTYYGGACNAWGPEQQPSARLFAPSSPF
jgi:hypothetical protein